MTFNDIFKSSFPENVTSVSFLDMAIALALAFGLGMFIFLVYKKTYQGVMYSSSFGTTLVALTMITTVVILAVTSNVVLSLGMVGALSIVRFRTAIKDSRDTVYIFWAIIVGICCGVGDYPVACIGSAVTFAVILLLGCIKSDSRILLIVRAGRGRQQAVKGQVYQLFRAKAILRVENTTEESVELIYELTQRLLRRAERLTPDIPDSLYALGEIEYVNLVTQNDEVSN